MNKKSHFLFKAENPVQNHGQLHQVHPAAQSLAKLFRRIGRGAMLISLILSIFPGNGAHTKLGFMILLPCGLLLIAVSGYILKKVKLYKYRLSGRDAELFAFVIGGCALIGLAQVLIEGIVLRK